MRPRSAGMLRGRTPGQTSIEPCQLHTPSSRRPSRQLVTMTHDRDWRTNGGVGTAFFATIGVVTQLAAAVQWLAIGAAYWTEGMRWGMSVSLRCGWRQAISARPPPA